MTGDKDFIQVCEDRATAMGPKPRLPLLPEKRRGKYSAVHSVCRR